MEDPPASPDSTDMNHGDEQHYNLNALAQQEPCRQQRKPSIYFKKRDVLSWPKEFNQFLEPEEGKYEISFRQNPLSERWYVIFSRHYKFSDGNKWEDPIAVPWLEFNEILTFINNTNTHYPLPPKKDQEEEEELIEKIPKPKSSEEDAALEPPAKKQRKAK